MRNRSFYLFALISVALALSLSIWMGQSIRLDEAQSVWQTSHSLGGVLYVTAKDVHTPLYFILLHYWEIFFGTSVIAIRSLSVLFFVLSIPAMYYLARRAYSEKVAIFASFITAISPFMNWYGSEARMYSLIFLATIWSHSAFIRLWREPRRALWLNYAASAFIGISVHPFFGFILLSQAVFFFARRDVFGKGSWLRNFSIVALIIALFGGVWMWYREVAGAGLSDPLLARPTSFDFFNVFSNFFIGFQRDFVNTVVLSLWPILVFLAFTLIARKKRSEPETSYFLIASFLPIGLALAVSFAYRPVFLSRYLIISLPSLYLLAVYFLSCYKEKAANIALGILSSAAVLMLFIQALDPRSPVKEDFRGAVQYVEARADSQDLFVVSAPWLTYPAEYYYRGPARLATFPKWTRYAKDSLPENYSPDLIAKDSADWAKVYVRVYMLFGYDQGYEQAVRLYMDKNYERVDVKTFSPGLSLYVYRLRYL